MTKIDQNNAGDPTDLPGISEVASATGIGRDTLRVWERRYGFPAPERNQNGERVYPAEQVERLLLMGRLLSQGRRPGGLIHLDYGQLQTLITAPEPVRSPLKSTPLLDECHRLLVDHDGSGLERLLRGVLADFGLKRTILDVIAPLNTLVGDVWFSGGVSVHEEHFYAEMVQRLLRPAMDRRTARRRPRVLLTTLAGEQHALGILMVEGLLSDAQVETRALGPNLPVAEIARAACGHECDIVGLSFSSAYPVRALSQGLHALRRRLPPEMALWAGGSALRSLCTLPPEVVCCHDLTDIYPLLEQWPPSQP